MQLRSPDGASVVLRITGYQFPEHQARGQEFALDWLEVWAKVGPTPSGKWVRDEDANWLRVRGYITLADGKTWAFEDPCLTTWDALELGSWLREVAAGTVPPSPVAGDEPEELLDFLEPNIAFSVEDRTADRVQIRIHFSLESLPPWLQNAELEPGLFEYFVRLEISAEELTRAAESWMLELAEFPER
jgi:hypothetical protein